MRLEIIVFFSASISLVACGKEPPVTQKNAPPGWQCGATGGGSPKWSIERGADGAQILKQSGIAPFPWCVRPGEIIENGFVEARFKPLAGREDQAGGVIWRWLDGDNYYVARANALENNVSLYYVSGGRRNTIKYVDAPVAAGVWHRLRVEFHGAHITVILDDKRYIEIEDTHLQKAGMAGVWTKADSVTLFDAFQAGR